MEDAIRASFLKRVRAAVWESSGDSTFIATDRGRLVLRAR